MLSHVAIGQAYGRRESAARSGRSGSGRLPGFEGLLIEGPNHRGVDRSHVGCREPAAQAVGFMHQLDPSILLPSQSLGDQLEADWRP